MSNDVHVAPGLASPPAEMDAARGTGSSPGLRYFVAFMFCLYGFAKLMGAQFTVLDSELDRPLREVPGFWLTWYYFGYSAVYGNLIALVQVVCAMLLTFRRTILLGASVLFGMISNIVLIDIFYGVDLGGLTMAVILWVCLVVIMAPYRAELTALFWPARGAAVRDAADRRVVARHAVRGTMLLVSALFMYWVANYNNRSPTPVDGAWQVMEASGLPADSRPSRIYFERNRAHMAVFQYPGRRAEHHFEVEPRGRAIHISREWLRKGDPVFRGTYTLSADRLELMGSFGGSSSPVHLKLARVKYES
ncbi:MAG TPA: hypothetical protein VK420_13085 [Longimicrobium sp.]|nr:hypothetical protein [Longimicrobium sp.]